MTPMGIDPSLAFTALMQLDPEFRSRTAEEGARVRRELLEAYYAQEETRNLWDFTPAWLARRAEQAGEASP
jgi:hypothetical protein